MVRRGSSLLSLFLTILVVQAVSGQTARIFPGGPADAQQRSVAHKDTFPGSEAAMNNRLRQGLRSIGWTDSLETLSHFVLRNIPLFAPPDYIRQKQVRNSIQRSAATAVAFDLVAGDGIDALLQTIKLKLEIAYAMQHKSFAVFGIPLPDNWDFPDDPWHHEWWMDR